MLVFLASLLEFLHLVCAEVRSDNLSEYFRALQVVFDAFFFELVDIRLGVAADEGNSGGDEVSRFSQLSEHSYLFIFKPLIHGVLGFWGGWRDDGET